MRTKGVLLTKDQLLDAAETVVVERGIGRLTLDAVAAQVGVSKGSVVYHFGSMDNLVGAMVQRIAANWDAEYRENVARMTPGPGRTCRAFLRSCMVDVETWPTTLRRTSTVMLAAAAHDERSIEPIREIFRRYCDQADDEGLPPGVGRAVMAAIDGVWFYWMLGLVPMARERVDAVRRVLEAMIAPYVHPDAQPPPA